MSSSFRPLTLVILLILCGIIVWQRRAIQSLKETNVSAAPTLQETALPPSPRQPSITRSAPRITATPEKSEDALRDRINELESQLAKFTKPLEADIRSATVDTEIAVDETLVTGGYKTPDGNTNFLFIQPEREVLPDGRIAVKLSGTLVALTDDKLKGSGVEDLVTHAANTLQHGEAWDSAEANSVIDGLRETGLVGMPSVITMPGQPAQVSIGENGLQYKVTPDFLDNGSGFRLRLRMEHPETTDSETN